MNFTGPNATAAENIARKFYPEHLLALMTSEGISVRTLERKERYDHASGELSRLQVDVDAWPAPPAGLFVVPERTLYVRECSDMTVAHELGHALDCALGGGVYRSSTDPAIKTMFNGAKKFVTPYAATAPDEYFAESVRAMTGANDPTSWWPKVSRERLRALDPAMFDYLSPLFDNPEAVQ